MLLTFITISTVGYGDFSPQTVLGRLFIIPAVCLGVAFGWASTEIQNIMAQESRGAKAAPCGKASFGTAALSGRRRRRHVVVMGGGGPAGAGVSSPSGAGGPPRRRDPDEPPSAAAASCATSSRSKGLEGARALLRRHAVDRRPARAAGEAAAAFVLPDPHALRRGARTREHPARRCAKRYLRRSSPSAAQGRRGASARPAAPRRARATRCRRRRHVCAPAARPHGASACD